MSARKYNAHPQSAPGDFYVVDNECISCGAPHAVAPDLIGWAENVDPSHCIWKRQPQTPQEIDDAVDAVLASEVACHRYAGDNRRIIKRLGEMYCDGEPSATPNAAVNLTTDSVEPTIFAAMSRDRSVLEALVEGFRRLFSK